MSIAGVCNRRVVVIDREESVLEAARLMREHHVGDVVVTSTNGVKMPVGIVTDRDIVISVVALGLDAEVITVGDVMYRQLVTVPGEQGVFETIQLMRAKGIRRLPVIDDTGLLIGIITLDDLLQLMAEEFGEIGRLIGRERAVEAHSRL
jgi:CBS domain-containing protein